MHYKSIFKFVGMAMVVAFFCVGCGSPKPSAVAERFFTALAKGDMETVGKYATTETMQMVATFGSKLQNAAKMAGKIKSSTETITDDTAEVTLYFENGEEENVDLVKVDGKWKVDMQMSSGGGK